VLLFACGGFLAVQRDNAGEDAGYFCPTPRKGKNWSSPNIRDTRGKMASRKWLNLEASGANRAPPGNEILCFDFAERWKGEIIALFLCHDSLKTRRNAAHFVPSDEKAKSHSTFTFSGRWAKIANDKAVV
jgi:hypothetical protein